MKKRIALLLAVVLVMSAFAGCGGTDTAVETPEMVLKWNLGADFKTIDPQLNSASNGGHIINNMYEGLMREVDGNLELAIAESYEISEDGTVYTFTLKDTMWSDGVALTAFDFEYAWKRALDPMLEPEPSEYAFQLFYIKGAQAAYEGTGSIDDVAITAIDEKTIEVELVAPTDYFLALTSFYTYMPTRQDVVEQDPAAWSRNPEMVVSNGPFKLTEYNVGANVVLLKNDNYWRADDVMIDRIEGEMITDQSTALAAYDSNDIYVIDDLPLQEVPRLEKEGEGFFIFPLIGTYYYIFQTEKEPFDDPNVRKALSYALDRLSITSKVTKGGQIPATGFTPPDLKDANGNDFYTVAGDYGIVADGGSVEIAQQLLADAGYPGGEGFPEVTLLYNTSESHKQVAEAAQAMWKDNLGITVNLANQEWGVFQDTRHTGNFDIARGGWLGDYADPMTMLDLFLSYSGNNDAQWNSPEFDALIEEAKVTTGEPRFDNLYAAQQLFMDEMVVAPVYYYTQPTMVNDAVKGWNVTRLGHWFFGYATVEAE